ncbi:unnamed protein product [Protopolystoma xenopodis]|uniref:Uncharacterized protein n=1 Tax=Protopolystoma xenopodis TaxID=117903 RepID=A0A448X484_9PLAT|nr:unnamed protein product [Protopolystoma xenopodis]
MCEFESIARNPLLTSISSMSIALIQKAVIPILSALEKETRSMDLLMSKEDHLTLGSNPVAGADRAQCLSTPFRLLQPIGASSSASSGPS